MPFGLPEKNTSLKCSRKDSDADQEASWHHSRAWVFAGPAVAFRMVFLEHLLVFKTVKAISSPYSSDLLLSRRPPDPSGLLVVIFIFSLRFPEGRLLTEVIVWETSRFSLGFSWILIQSFFIHLGFIISIQFHIWIITITIHLIRLHFNIVDVILAGLFFTCFYAIYKKVFRIICFI